MIVGDNCLIDLYRQSALFWGKFLLRRWYYDASKRTNRI